MSATFVVMGVAGSGKSRTGAALAHRLGWTFLDADDHHPPANVAKMRAGVPLTDADRAPWLTTVNQVIRTHQRRSEDVVVACSALKRSYRSRLADGVDDLHIVHLAITPEVAAERLQRRAGHFMPPELLASQFATLEAPDPAEALIVDADLPVDAIVEHLVAALRA